MKRRVCLGHQRRDRLVVLSVGDDVLEVGPPPALWVFDAGKLLLRGDDPVFVVLGRVVERRDRFGSAVNKCVEVDLRAEKTGRRSAQLRGCRANRTQTKARYTRAYLWVDLPVHRHVSAESSEPRSGGAVCV